MSDTKKGSREWLFLVSSIEKVGTSDDSNWREVHKKEVMVIFLKNTWLIYGPSCHRMLQVLKVYTHSRDNAQAYGREIHCVLLKPVKPYLA